MPLSALTSSSYCNRLPIFPVHIMHNHILRYCISYVNIYRILYVPFEDTLYYIILQIRGDGIMFEEFFFERLTSLRNQKNVSAREMSLALGQNESYINRIENRLTFPSMQVFFYICEYFQITPQEFFDEKNPAPGKISQISEEIKHLDELQLDTVISVIKGLQHKPK